MAAPGVIDIVSRTHKPPVEDVQRWCEDTGWFAQRTGKPVRTIHTHLQRAMAQLRSRLHKRDARWRSLLALAYELEVAETFRTPS